MESRYLRGGIVGVVLFVAAIGLMSYFSGGIILYRGLASQPGWSGPGEPACNEWHRTIGFVSLQSANSQPIDMPCEDARAFPAKQQFVTNKLGFKIHYRMYATTQNSEAPLWLHVHGITGSHLHGARYIGAAQRLDFQLVSLDLSNHGLSDNDGSGASYGCREKWDVLAVVQALEEQFPGRPMLVSAVSMGTMAVVAAADTLHPETSSVRALALEAPIFSLPKLLATGLQDRTLPLQPLVDLGLIAAQWRSGQQITSCVHESDVANIQIPTLVQIDGRDEIIPGTVPEKFYTTLSATLIKQRVMYPNAPHAAAWNSDPNGFEADLSSFWQVANGM